MQRRRRCDEHVDSLMERVLNISKHISIANIQLEA